MAYRVPAPRIEDEPDPLHVRALRRVRRRAVVWWRGKWRDRRYRCHCGATWPKRHRLYPFWAAKTRNREGCPSCFPIPEGAYHPELCLLCRCHKPWRDINRARGYFCVECWTEVEFRKNPSDLVRRLRGHKPPFTFLRS